MCNCGSKRSQLSNAGTTVHSPAIADQSSTVFEYIGKTALTITGAITGRRYRFNKPGDIQSIDPRDVNSVLSVPVVRPR